jgi:protein-tyrosine phosphatase
MAEGAMRMLLEKQRPNKVEVISAGTAAATGSSATQYAIDAATMWEVDISQHGSQPLTPKLIDKSDLILAMEPSHVREVIRLRREAIDKTYLLKKFPESGANGPEVLDPIGLTPEEYERTFLEIGEYLGKHLPLIVERIDAKVHAS